MRATSPCDTCLSTWTHERGKAGTTAVAVHGSLSTAAFGRQRAPSDPWHGSVSRPHGGPMHCWRCTCVTSRTRAAGGSNRGCTLLHWQIEVYVLADLLQHIGDVGFGPIAMAALVNGELMRYAMDGKG